MSAAGVLLLLLLQGASEQPGAGEESELTLGVLQSRPVTLLEGWRWQPGDGVDQASPQIDDRDWRRLEATDELRQEATVGWFRRELRVDESLWGHPLGLYLELRGSARLYLDGTLLFEVGEREEKGYGSRFRRVAFPAKSRQVLAVRYDARPDSGYDWMIPANGFRLTLGGVRPMMAWAAERARIAGGHQMLFVGAFGGQAVLHLLLFLFWRRIRSNAWFAMTTACSALLVGLHFERLLSENAVVLALANRLWDPLLFVTMLLLLRFTYEVFDRELSRHFWGLLVLGAGLTVLVTVVQNLEAFTDFWWFHVLVLADTVRISLQAARREWRGAWIILAGLGGLTIGLVWQQLLIAGALDPPLPLFPIAYYGVAVLLLSVSVYLAFQVSRMAVVLRERLEKVEELSQKTLEQELQAKEQEMLRVLLEADNRRKTDELEAARALQLSLLPHRLPAVPGLSIAVSMQTATEVGGDYYDFKVDRTGALIVAVGDAAGHGARAGSLVSLMKGMFSAFGTGRDVPRFFTQASATVRSMSADGLHIAMALARFEGRSLTYASAGMPPALVRRPAGGEIDEILIEGMPLGGVAGFPYEATTVQLAEGDIVLFMSDGLPELVDDKSQPLGYERVRELLAGCPGASPRDVVAHLEQAARKWSGGPPYPDDITLVVVKVGSLEP